MDPGTAHKINDIEARVESMEGKLDRVLQYLDNDPGTGREGIYAAVNRNRRDIERLDIEVREIKTKSLVDKVMWGGAGGGIIAFVLKLIEKLS